MATNPTPPRRRLEQKHRERLLRELAACGCSRPSPEGEAGEYCPACMDRFQLDQLLADLSAARREALQRIKDEADRELELHVGIWREKWQAALNREDAAKVAQQEANLVIADVIDRLDKHTRALHFQRTTATNVADLVDAICEGDLRKSLEIQQLKTLVEVAEVAQQEAERVAVYYKAEAKQKLDWYQNEFRRANAAESRLTEARQQLKDAHRTLDDNDVPVADGMGTFSLSGRIQAYINHLTERIHASERVE